MSGILITMKDKEILIKFFIDELKKYNTNIVRIAERDVKQLELEEHHVIQLLYIMQEDGLIDIKNRPVHDNFSMFWTIALKSECVHYFELKEEKKVNTVRERIRFWLPVIISIISLIHTIIHSIRT